MATGFTLTAPSPASGNINTPSGNFTVTPVGGVYTGTVTITPSGGGLSTPITLTWSASSVAQTFTITPTATGTVTLTPTNSGALPNPTAVTYTATNVATRYTVAGPFPNVGYVSNPSTLTYILGPGTVTGTIVITPNDGGKGGTFTPPTLSLSSGKTSGSVTYTPAATGTVSFSSTNNGGLTNPAVVVYTVMAQGLAAFPVNSWNDKSSMIQSFYKIRERYTRTRDPLPVMNYRQLEEALPPSYDLPEGEEPMEGEEEPPEFLAAETPSVEESEYDASLSPATGYVGDEISVKADHGLTEITEVYVNGIQAEFLCLNDADLVFAIPEGATSGTVELVNSSGQVINAGILEVASG